MLINLSNHPSSKWSENQIKIANNLYGEVIDLPFPAVNPDGDEVYIENLAKEHVKKALEIAKDKTITVHVMGEMNLTYALVNKLSKIGIKCVASTTERNVVENENGEKIARFSFVKFREYEVNKQINSTKKITLTNSQKNAFEQMQQFLNDANARVFILKGYAGTGKTTLMRFLIENLKGKGVQYKLLASTGRAAKVLKDLTGDDNGANTIHSAIYQFNDLNKDLSDANLNKCDEIGQLYLVFDTVTIEKDVDGYTIYIVDEASMISDVEDKCVTQAKFGSGRLLKELLTFDQRKNSKFIFVGDPCQLPPIRETDSPALSVDYYRNTFGFVAQEAVLTEIMRQDNSNSLVAVSKELRSLYNSAPASSAYYGTRKVNGRLNVMRRCCKMHTTINEMMSCYINDIKANGYENSICICRQNRRCMEISKLVRQSLGFSGIVSVGELLMVVQNNLVGLVNGDMVEVIDISAQVIHRAGQCFRNVIVRELYSKKEVSLLLMESILTSGKGNLDTYQQTALFVDFANRMKEKGVTQQKNKALFRDMMKEDPYLNALRCSYGYAITCHKAQGGEWKNVYLDVSQYVMVNPTKGTYQWVYTAMTRAKERLHMVDDFYLQ